MVVTILGIAQLANVAKLTGSGVDTLSTTGMATITNMGKPTCDPNTKHTNS